MAITVRGASDSEQEVERLMMRGLEQALSHRMSLLFGVLCDGCSSDPPAALERFAIGVNITRSAYLDARIVVEIECRPVAK